MRTARQILRADMRVVVVMPYEGIRHGLTLLLEAMRELTVVAQSSSVTEGVDLVHRHTPDVVILDAGSERVERAITEIRSASPRSHLVVTVDEPVRKRIEDVFVGDVEDRMIQAVHPGQLFATVRELLRQRRSAGDA